MSRILPLALVLASCASAISTSTESFAFRSRDWIKPSLKDVNATVQVKRISPELYATRYTFSIPLDPYPFSGTDPTSFRIFAFCVAAKLAAQNHRQYWTLGSTSPPDQKLKRTSEVEFFVALGSLSTEPPSTVARSTTIYWYSPASDTVFMRPICERILRGEHIWPK